MHTVVEAMPGVLGSHPEAHAVIVGGDHPLEPGYREQLRSLIASHGIADRVHLAGYQPDARDWMATFDVAVHASDNEPFGLVVLEAMALGKPLVAGARGGPAEIVRDGVDGFLVEYGDASMLAARITASDWPLSVGASNTTKPSFMLTIRLLAPPPWTICTLGASSTSLKLPPGGK